MVSNLLVLSNAYTKYRTDLASKSRTYPEFRALVKTPYTRGITIEDWNTLIMYTRMVMSDAVATSEYLETLTSTVKKIDDKLADADSLHDTLLKEALEYTDKRVNEHYMHVANAPALGDSPPTIQYTSIWLDTSESEAEELPAMRSSQALETVPVELVSSEELTFGEAEDDITFGSSEDDILTFSIDTGEITFGNQDEGLTFGD